MTRILSLALVFAPLVAVAAEPAVVAVLTLEANQPAADAAPGATSLLTSRLSQAKGLKVLAQADFALALGLEKQKQVLGGACAEDSSCLTELSGALGSRYVVSGRLDRFGERYVLTTTLFDSEKTATLARPRAEVAGEAELPAAIDSVVAELWKSLGVQPAAPSAAEVGGQPRFGLGLKLSNQFLASLSALNPGGEIEIGWHFVPDWMAFAAVGFNLVRGNVAGQRQGLAILPSVLGLKRVFRRGSLVQPYAGMGMGVQLSIGQFGIFRETQSLPTVLGLVGLQLMFGDHFGGMVEGSTNVTQAVFGLTRGGLGQGVNFDLSFGLVFRF